jgi:hypothetical protein
MSHIIGRGRYARETYPQASRAQMGGSIIQCGYDQNEKTQLLTDEIGFIPRDAADPPNPLQVVLENLTPGNFLDLDWSFTSAYQDEGQNSMAIVPFVFFNNTDPPDPPDDWFIVNSAKDLKVIGDDDPLATMRGFAAFEIPPDVESVVVRLFFGQEVGESFLVTGLDFEEDAVPAVPTLKVCELAGSIVTQPGPTNLVPVPE